jgi:hypothetical protein
MSCFGCAASNRFRDISRAMAKSAGARLRQIGALPSSGDWVRRAEICENCPMRVVRAGVSYCGTPFLQKIDREPSQDGCGCPTREKAKSPSEHCPITRRHLPSTQSDVGCNCKWCK